MRWIQWLAISAAVLVGVLAVLLTILFNMDFSAYEDDIERYLSEAIGRDVVIGGEFQADLGRTISLSAEDVKVANADWSSNPNMLEVGLFELRVDLWSLISGPVRVQHLELDRTRIRVEADADGRLNWEFGPEETDSDVSVPRIVLEHVAIKDFDLRYGEGWLDAARLLELDGTIEGGNDELLALNLDGHLDELSLTASGKTGSLENLLQGENISMDITAGLGEYRLGARGFVESLSPFRRPNFSVELSGPDVAELLEEIGSPVFTSGPLDLRGSLKPREPGIKLDVAGSVGEVALDAHGTLDVPEHLRGLVLTFGTSGPDLKRLAAPFGIDYLPAGAFRLSGQLDGERLPFQLHEVVASVGNVSRVVKILMRFGHR